MILGTNHSYDVIVLYYEYGNLVPLWKEIVADEAGPIQVQTQEILGSHDRSIIQIHRRGVVLCYSCFRRYLHSKHSRRSKPPPCCHAQWRRLCRSSFPLPSAASPSASHSVPPSPTPLPSSPSSVLSPSSCSSCSPPVSPSRPTSVSSSSPSYSPSPSLPCVSPIHARLMPPPPHRPVLAGISGSSTIGQGSANHIVILAHWAASAGFSVTTTILPHVQLPNSCGYIAARVCATLRAAGSNCLSVDTDSACEACNIADGNAFLRHPSSHALFLTSTEVLGLAHHWSPDRDAAYIDGPFPFNSFMARLSAFATAATPFHPLPASLCHCQHRFRLHR